MHRICQCIQKSRKNLNAFNTQIAYSVSGPFSYSFKQRSHGNWSFLKKITRRYFPEFFFPFEQLYRTLTVSSDNTGRNIPANGHLFCKNANEPFIFAAFCHRTAAVVSNVISPKKCIWGPNFLAKTAKNLVLLKN